MDYINIDSLIEKARRIVKRHELAEGQYCRWLFQDEENSREMGINEYGCADAANILYTIGDFVQDPAKREKWVSTLQNMQDPETGLFTEVTHHTIHTTAHCLAALELFDAQPLYPLTALKQYLDKEKLYDFLEHLNWAGVPWSQSHQGAGLYASMVITRTNDVQWEEDYFAWLREHCDPDMGMSYKGRFGHDIPAHHMYGWFHYLFNHEYARRPIPYADKLIDSCIDMYVNKTMDDNFAHEVGFMEIDWVFCMNRASRQTPHRFHEVKALLWNFAQEFIAYLESLDEEHDDRFNDLHMLFGALCALAELQLALPGKIRTTVPLKIVLDRRPFI